MRLLSVALSRRWAKGWAEHSLSAGRPAVHFLYEQELLSLSPRPIGRCQAAPRTLAFVSLCTHTREYIIIITAETIAGGERRLRNRPAPLSPSWTRVA